MSGTSRDEYRNGYLVNGYDYSPQCWVRDTVGSWGCERAGEMVAGYGDRWIDEKGWLLSRK